MLLALLNWFTFASATTFPRQSFLVKTGPKTSLFTLFLSIEPIAKEKENTRNVTIFGIVVTRDNATNRTLPLTCDFKLNKMRS